MERPNNSENNGQKRNGEQKESLAQALGGDFFEEKIAQIQEIDTNSLKQTLSSQADMSGFWESMNQYFGEKYEKLFGISNSGDIASEYLHYIANNINNFSVEKMFVLSSFLRFSINKSDQLPQTFGLTEQFINSFMKIQDGYRPEILVNFLEKQSKYKTQNDNNSTEKNTNGKENETISEKVRNTLENKHEALLQSDFFKQMRENDEKKFKFKYEVYVTEKTFTQTITEIETELASFFLQKNIQPKISVYPFGKPRHSRLLVKETYGLGHIGRIYERYYTSDNGFKKDIIEENGKTYIIYYEKAERLIGSDDRRYSFFGVCIEIDKPREKLGL